MGTRVDVLLVCGGRYHDVNRVRLDLLRLLAERDEVYVRVAEDYSAIDALRAADALVTYTCDVRPTDVEQEALAGFLARGGRWFALHGTNAFIDFDTSTGPVSGDGITIPGRYLTPDVAPGFIALLGSRFLAHPAVQPVAVRVSQPPHPLVAGLADFEVVDEAYCCEFVADVEVLLETTTSSRTMRRVPASIDDPEARRPLLYLRRAGEGAVLYLTLGHARGRFDMQPHMAECPVERGPWEAEPFLEVVRRGLGWVAGAEGDRARPLPQGADSTGAGPG